MSEIATTRRELRQARKQMREDARTKAKQRKCVQRWKAKTTVEFERPSIFVRFFKALAGVALVTLVFGLCFFGGYLISKLIFSFTGMPGEVWVALCTGLLGIALFALIASTFTKIVVRRHRNESRTVMQWKSVQETMDALNSITRGDFNVSIAVDEHDPFSELAASVNKMAVELDSAEILRQDFISNVSHEIQSPLTSITGFASLAKSEGISEEQRAHYLDVIESESKRLSKLSDNLLKLSALESVDEVEECQVFRLDKQIEHAVLMLEPQWAPKGLVLEMDLVRIDFSGDEALLNQVWVNLLHNAVKFTPENGVIRVEMEGRGFSDGAVDATAAVSNATAGKDASGSSVGNDPESIAEETGPGGTSPCGAVVVRVGNEGEPIAAEDQMHLFERFYKADKSRDRSMGGSGLGLSLVKKIVELHGGTVVVESTPEARTTFTVTLPII